MTTTLKSASSRSSAQRRQNPIAHGLPDPRPLTDYTAAYSIVSGHSRITITLSQPCIIRTPAWGFVDCTSGAIGPANSVTVVNNTTFYFDFAGVLNPAVGFISVPYQDMQVQNFQGGFVVPGAKWFREPVMPS